MLRKTLNLSIIFLLTSFTLTAQVFLGLYLAEENHNIDKSSQNSRLIIHSLIPNSPADLAGLQNEDVILRFDHKDVSTIQELDKILKDYKVGDIVEIEFQRDNKISSTKLTLSEKKDQNESANFPLIEKKISDLLKQSKTFIFRYKSQDDHVIGIEINTLTVTDDISGIKVVDIIKNSPAEKSGIKIGDTIIAVNNQAVSSVRDFVDLLQTLAVGSFANITLIREESVREVSVEVVKRKSIFQKD